MARRRSGGIYKLVYYNTAHVFVSVTPKPQPLTEPSEPSKHCLVAFSDCYQPSFGLSLQRNYPCFVQVVDRSRFVEISYSFREQWSVKIEKKHSMAGITSRRRRRAPYICFVSIYSSTIECSRLTVLGLL